MDLSQEIRLHMGILEYLKDLWRRRRFDIGILMIAAMFPVHRSFTSVILMVLAGIFAAVASGPESAAQAKSRVTQKYYFITVGFFVWMIFSLVYSHDRLTGLNFVVANSYLLFYPVVVLVLMRELSTRDVNLVLFSFVLSCLGLAFFLHWKFYQAGLFVNVEQTNYSIFPFREVAMANRFHPTYISMWMLFATLFNLQFVVRNRCNGIAIILLILMSAIFITTSVLMSAKIAILGFVAALLVSAFIMIRKKLVLWITCFVVVALFSVAVIQVSFLRSRFIDEVAATRLEPPVGVATNSLNIRVGIYLCSWEVFRGNWLIGTGIGDAQQSLNSCYEKFDTSAYQEVDYNTHNNFIGIAVATGIIGLLFFVWMFIFHFKRSFLFNNVIFLMFLVLVTTCMLGENILSRHQGVVFYSLFCSLFAKHNMQIERQS